MRNAATSLVKVAGVFAALLAVVQPLFGIGALDPTFGTGGKVATSLGFPRQAAAEVMLYPGNRIVAAGETFAVDTLHDFAVARYNADGSLDTTFGSAGAVVTDFFGQEDHVDGLAIQPDGKIVVVGTVGRGISIMIGLARFDVEGALDPSFDSDGRVTTELAGCGVTRGVAIQPDGKIVVAGGCLARYLPDGTLDAAFGSEGVVRLDRFTVTCFLLQPDGNIVVAGRISENDRQTRDDFALGRYDSEGAPDPSFGSGGFVTTDFFGGSDGVWAIAVQADGRIVAAGNAALPNDSGGFAVARYNGDGSLDGSFGVNGRWARDLRGFSEAPRAVAIQTDGRIVLGGSAAQSVETPPRGNADFHSDFVLLRLTPAGQEDSTLGYMGEVRTDFFRDSDGIRGLAIQDDGRIVAAGVAHDGANGGYFALARFLASAPELSPGTRTPKFRRLLPLYD